MLGSVENGFKHHFRALQNVVVPEAQGAKSALLQISVSLLVSRTLRMLAAIGFHDQTTFERHEIRDPRTNRHLPAKF